MSASHQSFGAIASRAAVAPAERRGRSHAVPAIVLAAMLGALWVAYFAVGAGVDYPEPLAQVSR